jgi:CrcB protein
MIKQLLLIFIGGGLGSCLRFLFSVWMNSAQLKWLPTLLVNGLGCLMLGFCFALFHKNELSPSSYALLGIGFCGGLTTFSTFSLDLFQLIRNGDHMGGLMYVGVTLILGYACFYAAYSLTKQFVS